MHCTYSEEVFWLKPEAQDHLRINAVGSESQSSDFHPSSVFWWDSRWPLPFVFGNKDWWNMIYFHFTEEQRIGKDVADNTNSYRSCCGTREWSFSFSVYMQQCNFAILNIFLLLESCHRACCACAKAGLPPPDLSPFTFLLPLSRFRPSLCICVYAIYICIFLCLCISVVLLPLPLRIP